MSRARRSAVAALVVLAVLGLLWPSQPSHLEANSFGSVPEGQRALFELLTELGLPVSRSYRAPGALAPEDVVWWIEPREVCATRAARDGEAGEQDAESAVGEGVTGEPRDWKTWNWEAREWLEAGGTALVFLPTQPHRSAGSALAPGRVDVADCTRLGPFSLPARNGEASEEEVAEQEQEAAPEAPPASPEPEEGVFGRWWRGELGAELRFAEVQRVEGDLVPEPRQLRGPRLRRFRAHGGMRVRARLDGEPFVLEREVGAGRLVVVADGSFLSNAWLDRADAAPLALDLVRAFGVPALDEHGHGLRKEQRALVYLAGSAAVPVFLGLACLGLLALWRGNALPRRAVAEADPGAPELERFVDSLATLYARSRDHAQLARRYRELSVARLRRHFGLSPETPARAVVERLSREGRVAPADLAALGGPEAAPVSSAAELRGLARRLDALVKEASR